MIDNNLFSICLPTCNRVNNLKEALPDLISKVKKYNVKIFISDNNSIDGTQQYVESLIKEYPHLHYHKVEISDYENANYHNSFEKNVKNSLMISDTKYRLLMGDHYILKDEDSIEEIYKHLNDDYDALILHHNGRVMVQKNDFIYTDKNQFLEELAWYISMVSTTIYSAKMVENLNFEKYFFTNYTHALAMLDYISTINFKIKYIDKVTTWTTKTPVSGLDSWHSKVLEIFTISWYKGIMSLPDAFDRKSKERCIKNHLKYNNTFYSLKSLLLYRYAQGITFTKILKHLKYFYFCSNAKVVTLAFFISLIPKSSIKYLFKEEYKYIKRILGNMDKYNM